MEGRLVYRRRCERAVDRLKSRGSGTAELAVSAALDDSIRGLALARLCAYYHRGQERYTRFVG